MRARASVRPRSIELRDAPDRPDTRRRLLETAGQVFAERGLDAVTGLEITKRAGVNSAAINYYFGGVGGLYEAVLLEARSRLPSFETLSAAVAEKTDARAKLYAAVELVVAVLTGPTPQSWILRLLMREILSPSTAFERLLLEAEGLPKLRMLKGIVAEIMNLPIDHPAVAQGCISTVAPLQVMLIGGRGVLELAYPELDLAASGAPMLVERMVGFALGGLDAIAEAEMARSGRSG